LQAAYHGRSFLNPLPRLFLSSSDQSKSFLHIGGSPRRPRFSRICFSFSPVFATVPFFGLCRRFLFFFPTRACSHSAKPCFFFSRRLRPDASPFLRVGPSPFSLTTRICLIFFSAVFPHIGPFPFCETLTCPPAAPLSPPTPPPLGPHPEACICSRWAPPPQMAVRSQRF